MGAHCAGALALRTLEVIDVKRFQGTKNTIKKLSLLAFSI